jgi:hypothetical protein
LSPTQIFDVLKLALSKDKVVLVHTLKALRSGGVTPLIMKLDPVGKSPPALPPGRSPCYMQNMRMGRPQSWTRHFCEEKIFAPA